MSGYEIETVVRKVETSDDDVIVTTGVTLPTGGAVDVIVIEAATVGGYAGEDVVAVLDVRALVVSVDVIESPVPRAPSRSDDHKIDGDRSPSSASVAVAVNEIESGVRNVAPSDGDVIVTTGGTLTTGGAVDVIVIEAVPVSGVAFESVADAVIV